MLTFDPATTDTSRKTDAVKRLDFYLDNTEPYVRDYLAATFPTTEKDLFPAFFNIVKKIINLLSSVYGEPANRSLIDATDKDLETFDTIIDTMNLDEKMKVANRYTNLLKTILLKPTWRNDRMELDIFTGDILDVVTGSSLEDIQQVIITHYSTTGRLEDMSFTSWTREQVNQYDFNRTLLTSRANPYQVIPFVPIHARPPVHDFWTLGGDDLVNAQESIYQLLSDLLFVVKYQGFGVSVLKEPSSDHAILSADQLIVAPNSTIRLSNKDSDFKIEQPKAPIKDVIQLIEFIFQQTAITNGLSGGQVSMKQNRQSGASKVIASEELREIRRNQIPTYQRAETQLFELCRTVYNTHNPFRQFSASCGFEISFPEIKLHKSQLTQEKQAEAWERELKIGISSPVEILMEKNPDLTRDQAIRKLEILKQERLTYMEIIENE